MKRSYSSDIPSVPIASSTVPAPLDTTSTTVSLPVYASEPFVDASRDQRLISRRERCVLVREDVFDYENSGGTCYIELPTAVYKEDYKVGETIPMATVACGRYSSTL
jgi:hypothetical protein